MLTYGSVSETRQIKPYWDLANYQGALGNPCVAKSLAEGGGSRPEARPPSIRARESRGIGERKCCRQGSLHWPYVSIWITRHLSVLIIPAIDFLEELCVDCLVQVDVLIQMSETLIHPAPRDALYVHQVHGSDIVSGGVLSSRATAESEGRMQGIVDSSESPLGGWGIDDDPPGVHQGRELFDFAFIVRKDADSVAESAVVIQIEAQLDGVVKPIDDVESQNGRQDLGGEWVYIPDSGDGGDEESCIGRHRNAGLVCDCCGGPADDGHTHDPILLIKSYGAQEANLLLRKKIGFTVLELFDDLAGDASFDDNGLFTGADGPIIKCF